MIARLRSWWRKARKPLEIAVLLVGSILVMALLVVIVLAYVFNVNVPGLRGKTLWDWLQLLIIPAVLAVGDYLFNYTTSRYEREATQVRDKTERDIASDNQREAALQAYLDKLSELLLVNDLRESTEDAEVRKIARVRTLTVLRRLDAERKGSVLRFLHESGLIDKDKRIIDLSDANLGGANLFEADLSDANLSHADLSNADLSGASLSNVDLDRADLNAADLSAADLFEVNLSEADLSAADLSAAKLSGANLSAANLSEATLSAADLNGANLSNADLNGANLSNAYLGRATLIAATLIAANLSGADLSGASVTPEQLNQAFSLKDTILPDGSKHSD